MDGDGDDDIATASALSKDSTAESSSGMVINEFLLTIGAWMNINVDIVSSINTGAAGGLAYYQNNNMINGSLECVNDNSPCDSEIFSSSVAFFSIILRIVGLPDSIPK